MTRLALAAAFWVLAFADLLPAQDLATLGITLEAPPGWAVAVQPDGSGATIARDATGARIRVTVDGPALSVADALALHVVEEPADTRIGGRAAVAVGLASPGVRSRVFTTVTEDGRAYRFDLEAPQALWDRHVAEMEASLATLRFGAAPLAGGGGGAPAAGGAAPAGTIETNVVTFRTGEPIPVNFSNLPGTYDWITIVAAGTPDDQFAEWHWSDGSSTADRPAGTPQRSGRIVFNPLPPGNYEVRLYHDWPNGGYRVRGRRSITVVEATPSAAARPAPARPAAAASSAFVGEWRTESSGYAMVVRLWAEGNLIRGTYDYMNGVIEGTVSGLVLSFSFRDGSGANGTAQFTLSADGSRFTGTWIDATTGQTGTWNGMRADAAPPQAAAASSVTSLGADFPAILHGEAAGWTSTWTRRGVTDVFDVVHHAPSGYQVVTVEQMSWRGQRLHIQRLSSSDGILCQMEGALTADQMAIEGTGSCPGVNAGWGFRLTTAAPQQAAAAAQAPACDVSGAWHAWTEGLGEADWVFTPLGGGWYDAHETGLGNARGRVFVSGTWIRAEVTTADGTISGTYDWYLGGDCASARGRLVFTAGRAGTHENSVIQRSGSRAGAGLTLPELAGTWRWFSGHRVVFGQDGTAYAEGTNWTAWVQLVDPAQRWIRITWSHGYVDDLVVHSNGRRMEGRNQAGAAVWGDRE